MFGPSYFADPHSVLRRLLEKQPVVFSEELGRWVVTRYDDAVEVLRDVARFSSAVVPRIPEAEGGPALDDFKRLSARWLFFLDPPQHAAQRAPMARHLAPRAVRPWEALIRQTTEGLLARLGGADRMDLIADYAHPLAVATIAPFLCATPEETDRLHGWCRDMEAASVAAGDRPTWERGLQSIAAATAGLKRLVAEGVNGRPSAPFLSGLLAAARSGALDEDGVCAHALVLLFAGVETTQNLIGNAVHALLQHAAERSVVSDEPGRPSAAVEECLRYDPPVLGVLRRAREDVELRGQLLRRGDEIVVMLGAANRDGARIPHPHTFDAGRRENPHLTFGVGPHYCPGAALARLTARIALEALFRRYPRLQLATPQLAWRDHDPIVRGAKALPVLLPDQRGMRK